MTHSVSQSMNAFPRVSPPSLDAAADLELQVIDWYIPEADRSEQTLRRQGLLTQDAEEERPPPPREYEIHMHGVTEQGTTVHVEVQGHAPYFFLRVPDAWHKGASNPAQAIKRKIQELRVSLLHEKVEKKWQNRTYMSTVVPYKLHGHLEYIKLVWRKDFWGFTNGKQFPFLKVRVKSLALFQMLRRFFTERAEKQERAGIPFKERLALYESNIDPFLRFIHERNLQPCGWIRLPGGTYDPVEEEDHTRAGYHVKVLYKDVHPLAKNKIAPLLIASFDLECTSSHGDFPVAQKDYRKLATDLLQVARAAPHLLTRTHLEDWLMRCFFQEVQLSSSLVVNRVYPKTKVKREALRANIEGIVDDLLFELQQVAASVPHVRGETEDPEDDGEEEGAQPFTHAVRDKTTKAILALLGGFDEKGHWAGALPRVAGDPIIQIGTTVHRYGSDEIVYRHIATLHSCDPIEGADVEVCETEEDLLLTWKDLMQRLDPDILTGYNIFGFDMKYVWDRAHELGVVEEISTGFGRLQKRRLVLEERKLSSSALGDNIMHTFDMDGVVMIDMLKVMQRDHKLDSYKLDHVAQTFLGDQKDDLKPREIFEKFQGTSADRCTIARYCLQDCALVNRLLHKLKVLENNIGMGNVCSVPLSYLFMRGQGVKIFSLVAKECRSHHSLIPVLKNMFRSRDDPNEPPMDEDGYEGAIVLEPKEGMYLDDPITVLDYSSLYPSSMISRNLSHDCYVQDPEYANLGEQGIQYLTVEYDVYEGTGDKKHVVDRKKCTFAQLPDGQKGIIPSILQRLLQQRKNTRKKIEYERLTLADGRVAVGLVKDVSDEEVEILNVDQADLGNGFGGHKATVAKSTIVQRVPAFHSFEQAVLDALQLAYKITANSLYGQIGSRTSQIYWKDIAACTTATGREMILLAKNFVETQYGAEVVYGDSVLPSTPVMVRRRDTGHIFSLPIQALGDDAWKPYDVFKAYDTSRKEKEQNTTMDLDAWTDRGWSPIVRVIRHKCAKRIYLVSTPHGVVEVTEDHSLLRKDRSYVAPDALTSETELLHAIPPMPEIASQPCLPIAPTQHFLSASGAQDHWMYLVSLGVGQVHMSAKILSHTPETPPRAETRVQYTVSTQPLASHGTRVQILYERGEYTESVYDLETEEGVFQAGVGSLIVKNTDSIFCKFPNRASDGTPLMGKEALASAIAAGQRTSQDIKQHLPPPQCLEYEKTFYPFVILSKKRYVGNLYEEDPNKKPKQKSMGIVLKRRDNAPMVKRIYGGIIDILLNEQDLDASVDFLRTSLQELVEGQCPVEDLVITKTLRAEYKDPTKIAHKVLAVRMGERDAGNKPMVNDRVPYVYIVPPPGTEVKLQGDRIEHPEYVREQKLTPDYRFYITNQLLKPISQLYALCLERLPGYDLPEEYWVQLEEEMKVQPLYTDDKKRKDRLQVLRMRGVEELLFQPFLAHLSEVVLAGKAKSKAKRGKSLLTASALASSEAAPILVLHVQSKEIKRGKRYAIAVTLQDREGAVLWSYAGEKNGVKMDSTTQGVQQALMQIAEGRDSLDPRIRNPLSMLVVQGPDKIFLRAWKQAIQKADEGWQQEIQEILATKDIGRLVEMQQMQGMKNLVVLSHQLRCVHE